MIERKDSRISQSLEFTLHSGALFWSSLAGNQKGFKVETIGKSERLFKQVLESSIRQSTNENVNHLEYRQFREKSIGRRTEEIASSQTSDSLALDNACDVSAVFPSISQLKEVGHFLPTKILGVGRPGGPNCRTWA